MKTKNTNVVPCDNSERGEMAVRMLNTLAQNDPDAWIENYPVSGDSILDPVPRAVVTARRNLGKMREKSTTPSPSLADSWSGPEIDQDMVRTTS